LFWLGLGLMVSTPLAVLVLLVVMYLYLRWKYVPHLVRIFQEKPLFVIPRGQPVEDAEDMHFPTADGLMLAGCYLKANGPRRGVILFGVEFGSNRWACRAYCEQLLEEGFDVFAYEPRCQGDSDNQPGYEPLQWVTNYEVRDAEAALAYLKSRPDADPRGIGLFGISKGAGTGLLAAARDPWVRCFVTDGLFATYSTLVPYMRQFYRIYNAQYLFQGLFPSWYYGLVGLAGLGLIEKQRGCRFPHLERVIGCLGPRPILMIHGGDDNYIKPDMGRQLFNQVRGPKEFWLVEGAKHNQALHVAGDEYHERILAFLNRHLAGEGCQPPAFRLERSPEGAAIADG
jgi:pimeloyl-ACP methyl ester carboxylesterase